jgi:hypothetical protein
MVVGAGADQQHPGRLSVTFRRTAGRTLRDPRPKGYGPGVKFWARIFAIAFATAAMVGAAQLGVAYGFSAIRLDRSFVKSGNDWNLLLTWIAWFAVVAVVAGASHAASVVKLGQRFGVGARLTAALSAGLGALVAVVPLTVYPAVTAKLDAPIHPALTVALTVVGATGAGIVLAALAAGNPPLTTGVLVVALVVWGMAIASMVSSAPALGRLYLTPARLGVLDIEGLQTVQRAQFSMSAVAILVSVLVALGGRARNRSRVLIAVCGTTGPLTVALAYLISGPGISHEVTNQADAYLGAMIAVVVGLIPSMIIALLPGYRPARRS